MIIITLYNLLNILDTSLEKHSKHYTNSTVDNFINNLKERIDSLEKIKKIPPNIFFSLDRYEGNFYVCENIFTGKILNIFKEKVDKKAKIGDILVFNKTFLEVDYTKTNDRINYINEITKDIFKK